MSSVWGSATTTSLLKKWALDSTSRLHRPLCSRDTHQVTALKSNAPDVWDSFSRSETCLFYSSDTALICSISEIVLYQNVLNLLQTKTH
ncbi:hypothetical protein INR49_001920 [Caranx melampygus]|nr:hypothetical protein INR49_001920 [Caranx melampygus]